LAALQWPDTDTQRCLASTQPPDLSKLSSKSRPEQIELSKLSSKSEIDAVSQHIHNTSFEFCANSTGADTTTMQAKFRLAVHNFSRATRTIGSAFSSSRTCESARGRLRVFSSTPPKFASRSNPRTLLGTTAGSTILVISGTVVLWPLSDLYLGPKLIEQGLYYRSAQEQRSEDEKMPSISLVSAESGLAVRHRCESANRPLIYISLREATSSHDLFMAIISGLFPHEKLGVIGTVAQSMGVWWIVLFDMVMSSDPAHIRKVNFSILLQSTKRALEMHTSNYPHCRRPLIILDHFDTGLSYHCKSAAPSDATDSLAVKNMYRKLGAWCAAMCYDEGLADVCVCLSHPQHGVQGRWGYTLSTVFPSVFSATNLSDVVYDNTRAGEFERILARSLSC